MRVSVGQGCVRSCDSAVRTRRHCFLLPQLCGVAATGWLRWSDGGAARVISAGAGAPAGVTGRVHAGLLRQRTPSGTHG